MASKIARISLSSFLRRVADILTPIRNIDMWTLGMEGEIEHNDRLPIELSNFNIEGTRGKFHDYLESTRSALQQLKTDHSKLKQLLKDPAILDRIAKATQDFLTAVDAMVDEGELDDTLVQKIHTLRDSLDIDAVKLMDEVLPKLPDSYPMPELEGFKRFPVPEKTRGRWFMKKKKAYCIAEHLRLAAAQIAATSTYVPHEWPQVGESFSTWMNSIKRVIISPTMLAQAPKHLLEAIETSLDEYIDLFEKKQELDVTTEDLKQLRTIIDESQQEGSSSKTLAGRANKLIPKVIKRITDFVEELRGVTAGS